VTDRAQVVDRERRRALPTAITAMAAVALIVASAIVLGSVNGDGEAELLRSVDQHQSAVTTSSILQALGFLLLLPALLYLFTAAAARSSQMRSQLIGVVIAAPLFLAGYSIANGIASTDAASSFLAGEGEPQITRQEAAADCREERRDTGADSFHEDFGGNSPAATFAACVKTKLADERAQDTVDNASAQPLAIGLGIGGRIGLAVALVYTALYGMRTGLLTRFWGSLGMALGVISFLVLQFTLVWFVYLGLLIAGWVPGGRPPAWAAGEAIPWPTTGAGDDEERPAAVPGSGRPVTEGPDEEPGPAPSPPRARGERRKRKQRRES
jgi:hypothetical protein